MGVRLTAQKTWTGDVLRAANLFAGWPDSVLRKLIETAELWRYKKGERVAERTDPGRGLWLVVSGSLSNFRSSPTGRYMLHGITWPGDVIGLAPVLDGGAMIDSSETRSDTLLLFLPQSAVEVALADNACLRSLTRALVFRFRIFSESSYLRTMDSQRCQIAKFLAYLPRRTSTAMSGPPGTAGWIDPAPVAITQGELAAMLGLARQTVNRVLGEFLRRKIVARDGETIRVISFKGLLDVMEEDEPLPPDWRAEILSWDEIVTPRRRATRKLHLPRPPDAR